MRRLQWSFAGDCAAVLWSFISASGKASYAGLKQGIWIPMLVLQGNVTYLEHLRTEGIMSAIFLSLMYLRCLPAW